MASVTGNSYKFLRVNSAGTGVEWATKVRNETLDADVDGSTTVFTLAHTPAPATSLEVIVNRIRQILTTDYTLSGNSLTMVRTLPGGTALRVDYEY